MAPTPEHLDRLASRNAVLISTVNYLPHPRDDYDPWRARWGQIVDLVDEIGRMVRLAD